MSIFCLLKRGIRATWSQEATVPLVNKVDILIKTHSRVEESLWDPLRHCGTAFAWLAYRERSSKEGSASLVTLLDVLRVSWSPPNKWIRGRLETKATTCKGDLEPHRGPSRRKLHESETLQTQSWWFRHKHLPPILTMLSQVAHTTIHAMTYMLRV